MFLLPIEVLHCKTDLILPIYENNQFNKSITFKL